MQNQNTILEDISAEIGYTATSTLCGWYGGRWLRVPIHPVEGHQISTIIGQKQFRVLVASFGGECIFVPKDRAHNLTRRNRVVFDMLMRGSNVDSVAARVNCSPRWVKNIRRTLEDAGLLPLVLKGSNDTD
jgi:hypothetical protein